MRSMLSESSPRSTGRLSSRKRVRLCDMLFVVKAVSPITHVLLWLGRGGLMFPPRPPLLYHT